MSRSDAALAFGVILACGGIIYSITAPATWHHGAFAAGAGLALIALGVMSAARGSRPSGNHALVQQWADAWPRLSPQQRQDGWEMFSEADRDGLRRVLEARGWRPGHEVGAASGAPAPDAHQEKLFAALQQAVGTFERESGGTLHSLKIERTSEGKFTINLDGEYPDEGPRPMPREEPRPFVQVRFGSEGERSEFDLAVVGESNYQDALRDVTAGREGPIYADAALVPEPDNPYDENAVKVEIKGLVVGYLNRSHARIYRQRNGGKSVSCRACISGGVGRGNYGVWLDLEL